MSKKTKVKKMQFLGPEEERVRKIIRSWYETSGMSQEQVGERVNMTQTGVSGFFQGRAFTTIDKLKLFCKAFGHEIGELFGHEAQLADPETERVMGKYRKISLSAQKSVCDVMDVFAEGGQTRGGVARRGKARG